MVSDCSLQVDSAHLLTASTRSIPKMRGNPVYQALRSKQTLFVPSSWNILQVIEHVAAVIKTNLLDYCHGASIGQLLRQQLVMIFPFVHEAF